MHLFLSFCPKILGCTVEAPATPYQNLLPPTDTTLANVDEVFVDLCRQIIRKDNEMAAELEEEPEAPRREGGRGMRLLPRRRNGERQRCVIL